MVLVDWNHGYAVVSPLNEHTSIFDDDDNEEVCYIRLSI